MIRLQQAYDLLRAEIEEIRQKLTALETEIQAVPLHGRLWPTPPLSDPWPPLPPAPPSAWESADETYERLEAAARVLHRCQRRLSERREYLRYKQENAAEWERRHAKKRHL